MGTTQSKSRVVVWGVLFFTFFCRAECLSPAQAYERLENLHAELNVDRNVTVRPLRDIFSSDADESASLLISKLQKLNSEERKTLPDPNDWKKAADFLLKLDDEGKNVFLRYDLANILADIYPKLSSNVQRQSLDTIGDSFTPSTFEPTGVGALIHSLQRVGPDAVPHLLRLADHNKEIVRCRASSALMSIRGNDGPSPPLDCRAQNRTTAIAKWQNWWNTNQAVAVVPNLPSIFDKIERPSAASSK